MVHYMKFFTVKFCPSVQKNKKNKTKKNKNVSGKNAKNEVENRAITLIIIGRFYPKSNLTIFYDYIPVYAGLGGSVGCAVRLETRRSRVQPPPSSATFFRGD